MLKFLRNTPRRCFSSVKSTVIGSMSFVFFLGRSVGDMSGKETGGNLTESAGKDEIVVGRRRSRVRRILFRVLYGALSILVLAVLVCRGSLAEPASYQSALAMTQAEAKVHRTAFEANIIELGNIVREKREWKTTITQAELNGWLTDNREFSKTLPKEVSDPRMVLADAKMSIIFRCEIFGWDAIIQGELDVFCTEVPRQIACRIYRVRSGWVPLPIDAFADQLTARMVAYGAEVEWSEIDGDPVALMAFPEDAFQLGAKILTVQAIEIEEGRLMITGKSKSKLP